MKAELKEKHYANVEEQTVLLRSIAESLAVVVANFNLAQTPNPLEVKSGSKTFESQKADQ